MAECTAPKCEAEATHEVHVLTRWHPVCQAHLDESRDKAVQFAWEVYGQRIARPPFRRIEEAA